MKQMSDNHKPFYVCQCCRLSWSTLETYVVHIQCQIDERRKDLEWAVDEAKKK